MIWLIAKREIRDNLMSLRFLLLLVLSIVLVPASFYSNYQSYLSRRADERQIEQSNRDHLRNLQLGKIFANPNFMLDVYWPPSPASVFASGFEESNPRHLLVGRDSVEYGAPLDVQSPVSLFGSLDYLFLVQFVFSLFAVLLSFDAISREKESGTLRSVLANSVPRAVVASGKLLGGYLTLAVPLVVSFLAGCAVLSFSGLDVFAGDFPLRAAAVLGASLLYVAVFFLLGLLVSALVTSTHAALAVSLCIWLGVVLLLPRAGALVSRMAAPAMSRQTASLEKLAARDAIEGEKGKALLALMRQTAAANDEGETYREKRGEVASPYDERIARSLARIEDDYLRRKDRQRTLGLTLARLSPAGSLMNFVTEASGTGMSAERRFLSEADRYRETMTRELFDRIFYDTYPGGGVSMGMTKPIDPAHLPEFRTTPAGLASTLGGVDLAILLTWFLLTAGLTYAAFSRYDVR